MRLLIKCVTMMYDVVGKINKMSNSTLALSVVSKTVFIWLFDCKFSKLYNAIQE